LGSGPVVVQIGAFSSQSLADKEWSKAAAVAPGAMAGRGKRVAPVTKDGVTLYRTAITGFDSRDQAVALCEKLKASGGTCFVH
jgi:cell division protein FtsN